MHEYVHVFMCGCVSGHVCGGKRAWEGENVAMQRCVVVLQLPCLHVALLCKPRAQGLCVCVWGGGGGYLVLGMSMGME